MENTEDTTETTQTIPENTIPEVVDLRLILSNKKTVVLPGVASGETFNAVRQALGEFQETAFTTCFTWKFVSAEDSEGNKLDVENTSCNEYSEINAFLSPTTKVCTFELIEDTYDANKARLHLKRFHDVVGRPYLISADSKAANDSKDADAENEEETNNAVEEKAGNKKGQKSEQAKAEVPPNFASIVRPAELGQYFNEALSGSYEKVAVQLQSYYPAPLSEVIKNVSLSGWNPVPTGRKTRGDLLYIEVVLANEGTVYVTATPKGFYINKCSRHYFDPSPAAHPHFAHDLFSTLYGFSSGIKAAWTKLCSAADQALTAATSTASRPLDGLAELLLEGNDSKLAGSWILPTRSVSAEDFKRNGHTYDSVRAQESFSDLCGPEDLGAPREWNDEIQSIGSLKAQEFSEKVIKARLEYKIISEFSESCKQIAVAISEGKIAPLAFTDPSQSDIFVYNGIFFNRAEDAKDAFKICEGEDACRKITSRDFYNQKLIRSLGVEDVTTVLCTIVDYKGVRYVGQSIIPGILSQGENSAQLLYGLLEKNKPLTIKNKSLAIMRDLGSKLSLAERAVAQYPYGSEEAAEETKNDLDGSDPLSKLLASAESQNTTIRVDTVDNIAVDESNKSLPHVGPIEAKIIKGSDGRNYVMELMRLAPRDANYVKGEKGSSLLSEEKQAAVDDQLANVYVLRNELINIFIQRKVNLARQALLIEATQKEEEAKQEIEKKQAEQPVIEPKSPSSDSLPDLVNEEEVQIVKESVDPEHKAAEVDDSLLNNLAAEYIEKFRAISPQSLGLEVNPNVFLNFDSSVDPEILAKDEETAREIAKFLWNYVLPTVTKQVREGDFYPKDLDSAVNYLHRMGVNMRYLGQLAELASEQEKDDSDLLRQGRQRVHSMPYYWQEFLIVEMLARSSKHLLNTAMRADKLVATAPAETVAALFNHVLSVLHGLSDTAETKVEEEKGKKSKKAAEPIANENDDKKSKEKGKKKKKAGKGSVEEEVTASSDVVQGAPNAFEDKTEFLTALAADLKAKYLYTFPLLTQVLADSSVTYSDSELLALTVLRTRLSPTMLVRRIAQQCGVIIAARNYNFQTLNIFNAEDILELVPKVKTFEPDSYVSEFGDLLASSGNHLQNGNAVAAFECAQQATNIIHQITGPMHLHAFQAADQLTAVLVNSSDLKSAIQMSTRCLALSAQVQGLDCQDTIQHHLQLSVLYNEANNNKLALQHLLSARYLLQIVAGDRHPEMANILLRMAILYEKAGDIDSAYASLLQSRVFANDLYKNAMILVQLASLCHRHGRVHEAVDFQKTAYKTLKELIPVEDERLADAKKSLELYIRTASTVPRPALTNPFASQFSAAAGPTDEDLVEEFKDEKNKKKKSNNKKNKSKK
eukprot:gene5330-5865_t